MQIDHFTITVPLNSHPIYNSTGVDVMQWRSLWRWPKRQTSNVSPHFTTECKFCLQSNSNLFSKSGYQPKSSFPPQIYPLVTCWLLFKVKKWWDVRVLTEEMCSFVVNCIGQCLCAALISPCSSNKIEAISIEIQSQYQFKCGDSKIAWICCWLCSHHDVRVLLMTSLLFDRLLWRIGILSVVAFFSSLQSPLRVMLQSDSFTEEGLCYIS